MNRLLQNISRVDFILSWCFVLLQALLWSRFLISISLIMLLVTVFFVPKPLIATQNRPWHAWLLHYLTIWTWRFSPASKPTSEPQKNYKVLYFMALCLPFAIVLVSGLWSENWAYWFSRLKIRLPFLILPIVFWYLPPIETRRLSRMLYFFCGAVALNLCIVTINYLLHLNALTDKLGQGHPLPFLKDHITFSCMAAFAVFCAAYLFLRKKENTHKTPIFEGILTLFVVIGLHIISVRTGLLSLYIALIISVLVYIFSTKKILVGALALGCIALMPYVAYKTVPSLERRINYAIWDFGQFRQQNFAQKSDSERIISLQMGGEVAVKTPILGVGFGDVMDEVGKIYAQKHPTLEVREPHSALLFTLIGAGVVGLLAFWASFILPIFIEKKMWLLWVLSVLLFCGNSVDFIIEASMGATFHAFFLTVLLSHAFFLKTTMSNKKF